MDNLLYIYIYDYKCLQEMELAIDTRYSYHLDRDIMRLSISRNSLPDNFWGAGVKSLSAIFGNNGAGKSTSIEFILKAIISAAGSDPLHGIVLYERGGELYVYDSHVNDTANQSKRLLIDAGDSLFSETNYGAELPDIGTFYYTGHYVAEYNYAKIQTVALQGFHNASDGCMLRTDLEHFANASDAYLNLPFAAHLTAHISQNNFRICRLLINSRLRRAFPRFRYPRYILIFPNKGGYECLKLNPIINSKLREEVRDYVELPGPKTFKDFRNQVLAQFVHFNLLNAIAETHLLGTETTALRDWYGNFNLEQDVLPQFREFIDSRDPSEREILDEIYSVLSTIDRDTHFNEKTGTFYVDAFKENDVVEKFIEEAFKNRLYLTSRFFDVNYSHDKDAYGCTLSSGEQKMLDLFSRLYDAIELSPQKYSNIYSPSLLILDEAEIGFHPEWQRWYIRTLLDFLHSLYVVAGFKYQIILTSHSPILLSDIPVCCCNFLKKDYENDRTDNVRESHEETFASNVFDLYRDSFFLENGLIGKFAEDRLQRLRTRIESREKVSYSEIALIGDPRLREYFMYHLSREDMESKDREAAIGYYRDRIRELESGQA